MKGMDECLYSSNAIEMKKKYDLILIDSGYCKSFNENVDVYLYEDEQWVLGEDDDQIGHGTGVLSIISNEFKGKYAVFKAFNLEIQNNIPKIISALKYILDNLDCKIVQMSFGVRGYYSELEEICYKLYQKNTLIVAAFDNCGSMSFPAAFDFVIGVDGNPYCKTKEDFYVFNNGVVDIQAKSGYQIVSSNSNEKGFQVVPGNSFATSYVSLKLLKCPPATADKENAMRVFYSEYEMKKKDTDYGILKKRLAVFPLNKENYSLLNYSDMVVGELVDFYDIKYTSNVGRKLMSFTQKEYTIKNIQKCDWDSFDTMIVGHVRELSKIINKNLKKEILEACLEHGKSVYCYDSYDIDDFKQRFEDKGLELIIADEYFFNDMFGKLYQIKTPILAVIGTSKKQGKFTLQMQIRKVLEKKEVKVGQLSTEPTGMVLGSDEMLPSGYDSKFCNENAGFMIQAYNKKIHRVDIKGYDIIITGAQSGFVPQSFFNTNQINIDNFSYLYGIMPDGVILAVNFRDSIDYIKKSIKAIEGVTNATVFLLALYAFNTSIDNVINVKKEFLTDEQIESFIKQVKEEIGLNVVVSGDERYESTLFDEIVHYYCEE